MAEEPRHQQGHCFTAADVLLAYISGARDTRDVFMPYGSGAPGDELINRAADAYVKSVNPVRLPLSAQPVAWRVDVRIPDGQPWSTVVSSREFAEAAANDRLPGAVASITPLYEAPPSVADLVAEISITTDDVTRVRKTADALAHYGSVCPHATTKARWRAEAEEMRALAERLERGRLATTLDISTLPPHSERSA